jgi:hypothetical protein
MNYESMWLSLKGYLQYLESRGVESVSPVVVSDKMDDIYNLEDKDDQINCMAVYPPKLVGEKVS